jgi:hypothetical protein
VTADCASRLSSAAGVADGQLDFAAQAGQGSYGDVFVYGPVDAPVAEHVIKLVDGKVNAVRRLTWEAEMLERAREEGGLLVSVLPDMVGLFLYGGAPASTGRCHCLANGWSRAFVPC